MCLAAHALRFVLLNLICASVGLCCNSCRSSLVSFTRRFVYVSLCFVYLNELFAFTLRFVYVSFHVRFVYASCRLRFVLFLLRDVTFNFTFRFV